VSGSTVRLVQYRYGATSGLYEFTSTNGGAVFGAPRKVGNPPFDDAVVGPGTTLSGVTNAVTEGMLFQNVPIDGTSAAAATQVNLSIDHPYLGAIALLDGTMPLAVFDNGSTQAQFRRYDGSGSLNSATNWTPPVDIGYADSPSLASGSKGLFMLSQAADNAMTVRRFNGTTFGPPVGVLSYGEDVGSWLTHDPGGRLHAVIPQGRVGGYYLVHAVSDDGTNWRSGTSLVVSDGGMFDMRAAVAADHVGVTVWWTGTSNGKVIRAAAIGPDAPVDPPASGDGTTTPPPGGGTTVPKKRLAAGLPSRSKPPATARRLANGDVRVAVKGVIRRPAGVSQAAGCRGTVAVRFKRGKRVIGKKGIRISRSCGFKRAIVLRRNRVLRARILAMSVRFKGNAAVAPARRSYKLPIKGRR
jgi:hypothetical protein